MDYDFSGICADQLYTMVKRLQSLHKSFVKEYKIGLNAINHETANEKRGEIFTAVEDILRDQIKKSEIFYTEALNKVQRELTKFLK